jgi:Glycosyl transferase family 11
MIIIQLNGGLGNQMFQYAFGIALEYVKNEKVIYDVSLLKYHPLKKIHTVRDFELDIFSINSEKFVGEKIYWIDPFVKSKLLQNLYINWLIFRNGLKKVIQHVNDKPDDWINKSHNSYLIGSFQSEIPFINIATEIRSQFVFKEPLPRSFDQLFAKLNSNSVAIHIRRSDYLKENNLKIHGICGLDYYMRAVKYISEKIKNPVFFVFSDDLAWVKVNLSFLNKYLIYYVDDINSKNSQKLQFMVNCRHFIVANSSFSWWGAWLSTNEKKIVVSPSNWYNDLNLNKASNLIIPSNWIRL